jgi:PiT family inorganic phosphate transporter
MTMTLLIAAIALFLAAANGANDNFKGFATVWGSATLSYRRALIMATLATLAGSVVALLFAEGLVQAFSGRGIVPSAVAAAPPFIASAGAGAALTVALATRLGFPISTTHALVGGLVGAGLAINQGVVAYGELLRVFFVPLLLSPVAAALLTFLVFRFTRRRSKSAECLCIAPAIPVTEASAAVLSSSPPTIFVGSPGECEAIPAARFSITRMLDHLHLGSASTICFARAVNDTPKLAALLVATQAVPASQAALIIGLAMVVGGLVAGRRVAMTMSLKINRLDSAQGVSANLVTAILVLAASRFGLPVSTTHVSVGSIAGSGFGARTIDRRALRDVLLSWVATLPIACASAWIVASLIA